MCSILPVSLHFLVHFRLFCTISYTKTCFLVHFSVHFSGTSAAKARFKFPFLKDLFTLRLELKKKVGMRNGPRRPGFFTRNQHPPPKLWFKRQNGAALMIGARPADCHNEGTTDETYRYSVFVIISFLSIRPGTSPSGPKPFLGRSSVRALTPCPRKAKRPRGMVTTLRRPCIREAVSKKPKNPYYCQTAYDSLIRGVQPPVDKVQAKDGRFWGAFC